MIKKLWQGAFEGANKDITKFNSGENIWLDEKLVEYDILGSIAHVKMLDKQKILKEDEAKAIINALNQVLKQHKEGKFSLAEELEDVHSNVENAVTKITEHGKKMHTARSRNDQVLLDMRLFMRDEILDISKLAIELQKSFVSLSKNDGPMVGYTHTRVAQPITVSFWSDAFVQSLNRDIVRLNECFERVNSNPLGACALAGTSWGIDRAYTAKLLGFSSVQENELDTIGSRGEMEAELVFDLATIMTKLSGLAEELIWLSQKKLVELPDEFCTGSSIMPNKKNPDVLELVRARSARVSSNLMHILGVKKGLISGYHSDMQETKKALMQATKTTKESIQIMAQVIDKVSFNQKEIEKELEDGFAQATEIADALVKKGVSFREAHGIVGKLVNDCEKKGISLSKMQPLKQFTPSEWKVLVMLDRKRLKKSVFVDKKYGEEIQKKQKSIDSCYAELIR